MQSIHSRNNIGRLHYDYEPTNGISLSGNSHLTSIINLQYHGLTFPL